MTRERTSRIFVRRGALALLIPMFFAGQPAAATPPDEVSEQELPARSNPSSARDAELGLPGTRTSQGATGGDPRDIESLMRLPSGFTGRAPGAQVAGASESEWKRRFRQTQDALAESQSALEKNKQALDGIAVSGSANQWSVAAPGGGGGESPNSGSPLSFKLRQELKQNRVDLEAAEKAMKELVIEADLAGVPESWRGNRSGRDGQPPSEVGQLLD